MSPEELAVLEAKMHDAWTGEITAEFREAYDAYWSAVFRGVNDEEFE